MSKSKECSCTGIFTYLFWVAIAWALMLYIGNIQVSLRLEAVPNDMELVKAVEDTIMKSTRLEGTTSNETINYGIKTKE